MSDIETMAIVAQVGEMHFEGNIIPQSWFAHLKYPSGKPYLTAMVILAEIVYWFRPREGRDGGRIEKKFKEDALQRTYDSFAEQFGFNKRETVDAVKYLVQQGLISTELRTVWLEHNKCLRNVLFILLDPQRLRAITYSRQQIGKLHPTSVQTEAQRTTGKRTSAETEAAKAMIAPTSVSTEDGVPPVVPTSVSTEPTTVTTSVCTEADALLASATTEVTASASVVTELTTPATSVQTEGIRRDGSSAPVRMEGEPPRKRGTNTDNTVQEKSSSESARGGQARPAAFASAEVRPPTADFPLTLELEAWCRQKFGKPLFAPRMREETIGGVEEALVRLDARARACGQSALEVLTTRLTMRPEVQQRLRQAASPYEVIARQIAYALEDYAERAQRTAAAVPLPVPAPELPTRRRANSKPAWMSDEEWAFHQEMDGGRKEVACATR